MNKILRLTLLLVVALVSGYSYAADVVTYTLDGTQKEGDSNTAYANGHDITQNDVAWNIAGNLNMDPWRIGGKKLTNQDRAAYSQTAIAPNVTKIEVDHGTRNLTVNSFKLDVYSTAELAAAGAAGDVSSITATAYEASSTTTFTRPDGADWTGRFYRFTWNVTTSGSSNQYTQLKSIKFYKADDGTSVTVAAPTISGETPFTESTTVTITVPEGTTVYYTTDGTEPSNQGDDYTAPFTLTKTTTVKAVAYDNAGNKSEVVTKEFVKQSSTTITNDGTEANPYTPAEANAVGAALASGASTPNKVYVKGIVSTVASVSTSYGNARFYISADGTTTDQFYCYDCFNLDSAKFTAATEISVGDSVVVYGTITNYNGTVELARGGKIVKTNHKDQVVETQTVADIAAFNALADGTPAILTLTNAQVLYSFTTTNGNNSTYIRDSSGALCLRNAGLGLTVNQVLNGTVNLTRSSYNNLIQGIKNDNTSNTTFTATDGATAEAKSVTVAEAKNYVSDLVEISDVNIEARGERYYAFSGSDSIQVYNGFYLEGYTVAAAEGVTIKGIVTVYNQYYEIQPVEVPVAAGIDQIKNDGKAFDKNAPLYNLAGQRVSNSYKGVVIQNGRKFIQK